MIRAKPGGFFLQGLFKIAGKRQGRKNTHGIVWKFRRFLSTDLFGKPEQSDIARTGQILAGVVLSKTIEPFPKLG
jgi:hypothetical protein